MSYAFSEILSRENTYNFHAGCLFICWNFISLLSAGVMETYEGGDDVMNYSNAADSQELGNILQGGRQEKRQHSP